MPRRSLALAASCVVAFCVAEGKLAWHSYELLDVNRSAQSLFLQQAEFVSGRQVYATTWPYADRFVVRTVGARCFLAPNVDEFFAASGPDDLWLGPPNEDGRLVPIASTGRQTLYRRAH
jgi:hypothetical protein